MRRCYAGLLRHLATDRPDSENAPAPNRLHQENSMLTENPTPPSFSLSLSVRLTLGFAIVLALLLATGGLASWQIHSSLDREQLQAAAELSRNRSLNESSLKNPRSPHEHWLLG
jgi:hypothetical protein